jgi:hypothetical protein
MRWRRECQSIPIDVQTVFHSSTREPTVLATNNWLPRRRSRTVGLFAICLPQVRAEHFVLNVPGWDTKLN